VTAAPIVLVPGFWLGAWAWDEVLGILRAEGHDVTAVTLPGLESVDADRSSITLADHAEAICEAIAAAGAPVVLAVHSGAGAPGYVASDRIPEQIAAMVYVDSGPATGAIDPGMDATEWALPGWDELDESRRDVPTVVICTSFSSDQIKAAVAEGYAWTGGLAQLRDVTWVDLPTSHWPMWSRPKELAGIIGDVAKAHAS
jgi:pimeloyl-ACP methyl ester carboxylesterase